MKPLWTGIIVIVAVIAGVFVGSYLGVIDLQELDVNLDGNGNDMPEPVDSEPVPEFDKFDIWGLLCQLTDKNLDRETTYEYIDRLNMEVFGSDTSYVDIYGEYSIYYEERGWDIEYREFPSYPNGDGAIIVYSNGINVAVVATATTDYMEATYGYNTMTLTATGTVGDFTAFYNFIETS